MSLRHRLASLWRNIRHSAQVEQELTEEVQAYLNLLIETKIREGLTLAEARRADRFSAAHDPRRDEVRQRLLRDPDLRWGGGLR